MNYPNTTGYQKNSDTSRESARMLDETGSADSQANFIIGRLSILGRQGATADEMTIAMKEDGFPNIHNGTVAGRIVHLERQGHVYKTPEKRKTRANRQAVVYVLHRHADPQWQKPARQTEPDAKKLLLFLETILQSARLETDGTINIKLTPMDAHAIKNMATDYGLKTPFFTKS